MTVLILARHGRTSWNDEGRYQGQSDVPLNEHGLRQARFLAEQLRSEPLSAVYSSDLRRSYDTARAIARRHRLSVHADPRFREINQGRWDGLLHREILTMDGPLAQAWTEHPLSVRPPGGESLRAVHERVVAATAEALAQYAGGVVCVVTHKVTMVVLRSAITGEDLERRLRTLPANAAFEKLDLPNDPPWFAIERLA